RSPIRRSRSSLYTPAALFASLFRRHRPHRDLHSFPTRRSSDLRGTPDRRQGRPAQGRAPPPDALVRRAGVRRPARVQRRGPQAEDRKSTRLNSSHVEISYAVFCLKKKIDHYLLLLATQLPDARL